MGRNSPYYLPTNFDCATYNPCKDPNAQSNHLAYVGAPLPCIGVNSCDTLTTVIAKINGKICELYTDTETFILPCISGEALASGRVVIMEAGRVIYFDPFNENHAGRFLGITKTSVSAADQPINVQTFGLFYASWLSLTPDAVYYIGPSGTLTTVPYTGITEIVGTALDSTSLQINSNQFFITI